MYTIPSSILISRVCSAGCLCKCAEMGRQGRWVHDREGRQGLLRSRGRDGDPERAAGQRDRRQPRACRPGQVHGHLYVQLMRDYAASTTAGDFTKTSEEQNVERALKTFVSTHLSGVLVVDRWEKDDKTGKIIYSLAKLDLDKFKEQVGQMKELNDAARDFVRKNAEKAFERLQQEEDKRGAK